MPFLNSRVYRTMRLVRIPLLILTLALCSTFADAQTTWQGLTFGQTREQAKAQLGAQNFAVETSQNGMLQSVADYDLLLPGFTKAMPFRVDLLFIDDRLIGVNLSLDTAGMHRNFPDIAGEDLLSFAASHLAHTLSAKYGSPLFHDFACDTEPAATHHAGAPCTVSWRGNEQSVSLFWTVHHSTIVIRYTALTTDL
jgi:hypothetical protein